MPLTHSLTRFHPYHTRFYAYHTCFHPYHTRFQLFPPVSQSSTLLESPLKCSPVKILLPSRSASDLLEYCQRSQILLLLSCSLCSKFRVNSMDKKADYLEKQVDKFVNLSLLETELEEKETQVNTSNIQ